MSETSGGFKNIWIKWFVIWRNLTGVLPGRLELLTQDQRPRLSHEKLKI